MDGLTCISRGDALQHQTFKGMLDSYPGLKASAAVSSSPPRATVAAASSHGKSSGGLLGFAGIGLRGISAMSPAR
jgi:hypothetical protein